MIRRLRMFLKVLAKLIELAQRKTMISAQEARGLAVGVTSETDALRLGVLEVMIQAAAKKGFRALNLKVSAGWDFVTVNRLLTFYGYKVKSFDDIRQPSDAAVIVEW